MNVSFKLVFIAWQLKLVLVPVQLTLTGYFVCKITFITYNYKEKESTAVVFFLCSIKVTDLCFAFLYKQDRSSFAWSKCNAAMHAMQSGLLVPNNAKKKKKWCSLLSFFSSQSDLWNSCRKRVLYRCEGFHLIVSQTVLILTLIWRLQGNLTFPSPNDFIHSNVKLTNEFWLSPSGL